MNDSMYLTTEHVLSGRPLLAWNERDDRMRVKKLQSFRPSIRPSRASTCFCPVHVDEGRVPHFVKDLYQLSLTSEAFDNSCCAPRAACV